MSRAILGQYFDAFNAGDIAGMVACLTPDVVHYVNEGDLRCGPAAFEAFCQHMAQCYDETLTDLVLFMSEDGARGAAEYTVNGIYQKTDAGLPEARGQQYQLPAGSFFSVRDGRISRVVTYYNLRDWIGQVS